MTKGLKAGSRLLSVAALVMAFAASGAAQARGTAHAAPAHTGGVRITQRLVATPLQPNFAPVPGLGFDFQSLAATALTSRHGRTHPAQAITPILWYYPYSPYVDYGYASPLPPPPYVYVDQQPSQAAAQPPQSAPSEQPADNLDLEPLPAEVSQFILVRLDGQVLFAEAFTAVDGRLTYVTPEGLRRSFPVSELDQAGHAADERRQRYFHLSARLAPHSRLLVPNGCGM